MVAEISLNNMLHNHNVNAAKGTARSALARLSPNSKLAEMQLIAHEMALDPELKPSQRMFAMRTFAVLEERRRLNLGKANPAPVKSEPRSKQRKASTGPASEPTQASVAVTTTAPKP